jgi:hypothetical protein
MSILFVSILNLSWYSRAFMEAIIDFICPHILFSASLCLGQNEVTAKLFMPCRQGCVVVIAWKAATEVVVNLFTDC